MVDSGEGRSYRDYFERAPVGVFVVDDAGACVDANPAACALLGYERPALLSKSTADLSGPDAGSLDAIQDLPATGGRLRTDGRLRHADGHAVPVAIDAVALDADRVLVHCRDRSERDAPASEPRYRSMENALDTSRVGTFILDSDFRVGWVSEAITEYFGVPRADLVGADKAETIRAEIKHIFADSDRFADTVLASYEDNSYVESFTCHVTAGEGREERWLRHWSTPIERGSYAGGRIEHYADITETVAYEHSLEEQRDNLRVLNEVMGHDIRNDLQLVLANAEFLGDLVDEPGQSHVETILASAEEAVELTRTARETADMMLAAGEDHVAVGLRSVLEGELDAVRETNPGAVLTVETTIPAVTVRANELLASVFRNLLQNAVQHNEDPAPEVSVAVTERPDTVVVRVADNGPGICDERKAAIFGRHEKGLDSPGTGLGLYLVATLVERYGGSVGVEDRTDGESGTVFVVELPTVG